MNILYARFAMHAKPRVLKMENPISIRLLLLQEFQIHLLQIHKVHYCLGESHNAGYSNMLQFSDLFRQVALSILNRIFQ